MVAPWLQLVAILVPWALLSWLDRRAQGPSRPRSVGEVRPGPRPTDDD